MLLEARQISHLFSHQDKNKQVQALSHIHFAIDEEQTMALVGESGSGKTTLARILMRLILPTKGDVFFQGAKIQKSQMIAFRKAVRMVFQDPFSSLDPRFTVAESLNEALVLEKKMSPEKRLQRMKQCLNDVGLPEEALLRFPHEFSGGERQRICIARALMTEPSLLILDEPVSSLDVLIQDQILTLLQNLQKNKKMAMLVITHHLGVAKRLCQTVMVMKQGHILEKGMIQDIFQNPQHHYTQSLLKSLSLGR